jgi:pectate lyase
MRVPFLASVLICASSALPAHAADSSIPAFPGAEGYGASTRGGRGGNIIAVTNLNNSGPGSLQAACEAEGPRIVVFKVAGTIDGDVDIENDFITIAGQTAPGDGITIKGNLGIDANDVVIRYIRVRTDHEGDAVGGRYRKNIILDHVSASWSSDEVLSLYHNENVTIQWCIITEACAKDDGSHRFGGIWGNHHGTYHHNLIAHNDSRNPRWASGCGYNDYRNNVLFNWGYQTCYGGEAQQRGDRRKPPIEFSTINMVANYYKPGPATRSDVSDRIAEPSSRGDGDEGSWYVAGNYVEGSPEVTTDNWLGVDGDSFKKLSAPWEAMPIRQQSPEDAYLAVLEQAGCSLPERDSIDARIIEEVKSGTATHGNNGIIDKPDDVGGWPMRESAEAPQDSDNDGMPDAWETQHALDPSDAGDNAQDADGDGYTNVEECLNGTDPTEFVDYTKPENNVNTLEKSHEK